jgi:hypothetical protein
MHCIMRPSRAGSGGHSSCTWARSSAQMFGRDREGGSWAAFCCFGRYPYPSYDSGYRQPYPPGYWAGYPADDPGSYAPHYDPQGYAPHDQQHYQEYGGPGDATSAPAYGQPTYLSVPPVGHGEPAQGFDQPSYGPPSRDQSDLNTTVACSASMQVRRTATLLPTPWPATERSTRVASVAADPSDAHDSRSNS